MEGLEEYQDMNDDFWNKDYSDEYYNMRDFEESFTEEKFLPIPGYDGKYEISNYGQVRSLWDIKNIKFLSSRSNSGWPKVDLIKTHNGNRISVRRSVAFLIAENFIKNPNNFKCIQFKDGDFHNLYFENIEWVFESYCPNYEIIPYTRFLPPKY